MTIYDYKCSVAPNIRISAIGELEGNQKEAIMAEMN
jgi:hypothetical protein